MRRFYSWETVPNGISVCHLCAGGGLLGVGECDVCHPGGTDSWSKTLWHLSRGALRTIHSGIKYMQTRLPYTCAVNDEIQFWKICFVVS